MVDMYAVISVDDFHGHLEEESAVSVSQKDPINVEND